MTTRWYHIAGLLLIGYILGWWIPKIGNTIGLSKVGLTPIS